ncbi:transcriptional regulator [Vibrio orientalis CIP 102891 = ATCC 33934]|uniref:Transcriptional regulator n=1 Tax=Vibrio orientalis CIP 102891 = ATCC 33934 TaxID=675816 RepID=C9QES7_VIBOR|nr:helix-turn-helix domain-containing protein [Vibrio orientalis]EEX94637.1 transcriptional regulator AraC family [Vibrio orientalis CIP 102891 = ATCC 33934]EGU51334.1 transcriptional regulator [Vibrio orientalis CIP 102891 = ATCC 33934]
MNRVAILAHSHVTLFEMSCAVELFALPRPEFEDWYQTDVINMENKPISTTGNIVLTTQYTDSLEKYDTLIIPGWPTWDYPIPDIIEREVSNFVSAGKRLLTLCSGAFLPAKLGLLDGKVATTHWMYEKAFREQFPQIRYQSDVLYVFDGSIGCSAGSASALDLGLAVIRQDYGYAIANQVAKRLVVSAHRQGGQTQFVETPILEIPNQFSDALDWANQNLDKSISVDALANKANMSRRTFDRKFRASFDLSPKEWLIQQRVERAKGLLENNSTSIERLANQAGFENATTMRHHFRRLIGISPHQYRNQFNNK